MRIIHMMCQRTEICWTVLFPGQQWLMSNQLLTRSIRRFLLLSKAGLGAMKLIYWPDSQHSWPSLENFEEDVVVSIVRLLSSCRFKRLYKQSKTVLLPCVPARLLESIVPRLPTPSCSSTSVASHVIPNPPPWRSPFTCSHVTCKWSAWLRRNKSACACSTLTFELWLEDRCRSLSLLIRLSYSLESHIRDSWYKCGTSGLLCVNNTTTCLQRSTQALSK